MEVGRAMGQQCQGSQREIMVMDEYDQKLFFKCMKI